MDDPRNHEFGGNWTSQKLGVLEAYLKRYTTALKEQSFRKGYIDAFAGTGYRQSIRGLESGADSLGLAFPELGSQEPQQLLEGSARIALKVEPGFDKYIFIEKRAGHCAALESLRNEFPDKEVVIKQGDANAEIRELCQKDWKRHRAVLFLDPYGMQVEWATIEAIARTKAIDLWILFPLGIGVNRLLKNSGDIPQGWRDCLTRLFGTAEWFDAFYKREEALTLFGEETELVKVPMETIGRFYVDRLKSIFAGVIEEPGVLRNSSNSPLYLLCFAAANPKGAKIAVRIAKHLLKDLR